MFNLAKGVQFDKATHTYTYCGRRLQGVTGLIGDRLSLHYGGAPVDEKAAEGTHVHEAVQTWIESGLRTSGHPAVTWIMNELKERWEVNPPLEVYSEVLVTDYDRYASAVDLMAHFKDGWVLYDIKTGRFKPEYLAWQLGVYKYFVEKAGLTVISTECICTRDKMFYVVRPRGSDDVEKLLYKI